MRGIRTMKRKTFVKYVVNPLKKIIAVGSVLEKLLMIYFTKIKYQKTKIIVYIVEKKPKQNFVL